ncbi:40S ribosomal protein S11, putative [Plasmodium malariae]|uniref:40S ribosomal protein S11, putative n=1 Tax=Plasmodium malariae TaxID=5858 RepID=A0A1A8VW24_PLAMA|nr:40S ribosomal protein S11, putative [Plasmodium malariae]
MATTLDVQHERAYQKQEGASFFNSKKIKKGSKSFTRYWKKVGLGFATPKEAKEGVYVDKKCPFTGNVSIRGRILKWEIKKKEKQKRSKREAKEEQKRSKRGAK